MSYTKADLVNKISADAGLKKADAEKALRELRAGIQEARKDMSQCTNDLDNGDNRSAIECMANAPNADAAMFCVL